MPPRPSLPEIFLAALRLGCTSFGGPIAHLAYFRQEYVEKRRWLDEGEYAELVALCQFLPGPASSQVGFGVGYLQRNLAGGLAAWAGFTLPSAVLMIGFAYGINTLGDLGAIGWLTGLKAAAVAVVAQAVGVMGRSLCPDWPRRVLALFAAGIVGWEPLAWTQLVVIALGAAFGWLFINGSGPLAGHVARQRATFTPGAGYLAAFFLLLLVLPWVAGLTANPLVDIFDRFYRTGALVFGGGHVVLPLLEHEVVAPGWVTHHQFLSGYGAAQAVPGPLFTLSAYLGAVMSHGPGGAAGGGWALAAIFLPAMLLVAGVLPFWQKLRTRPAALAAMAGTNAAVVGILLAALWHPVGSMGITSVGTLVVALGGFVALWSGKIPAWAVVVASAAGGAIWF